MKSIDNNTVGIGLRLPHIHHILEQQPDVDWFEVHSCNFVDSRTNLGLLNQVAEHYALSFHGVSMNLGGIDPLSDSYLRSLKHMCDRFQPTLVSDHACFTTLGSRNYHDLLPVPFSFDAVQHMAKRIIHIQDVLQRQILLENVSRYFNYPNQDLSEAEFLTALIEESNCGLLLDINNAYVNQMNHQQNAVEFCQALPTDKIQEIHLAGHHVDDKLYIDSHSTPIADGVWALFQNFVQHHHNQYSTDLPPALIEWDNQLPTLDTLLSERDRAREAIDNQHNANTEKLFSKTSKAS
ncbi:MAG: hypothetical protein CL693_11000 [Cellvibrionaceae bacterium]|nr:hypothetical protein [Cellvibrionaceae bacterium]|tara:strand:+ start:65791 stop:66672 length:882 start_codon:yes stop_codon:yes gene_type:complete